MDGLSYFFTGLKLMATVSDWSQKALSDGKVTLKEAVDLAERVCPILGVKLEIDLTGDKPETDLEQSESTQEENDRVKRSWE